MSRPTGHGITEHVGDIRFASHQRKSWSRKSDSIFLTLDLFDAKDQMFASFISAPPQRTKQKRPKVLQINTGLCSKCPHRPLFFPRASRHQISPALCSSHLLLPLPMASESVTINSTAPELRMVRRLVPASMSGDSVPGSGIPGRIYNFTTPSFMDVRPFIIVLPQQILMLPYIQMDEGVGKDATVCDLAILFSASFDIILQDPESRRIGSSDSDAPQPPSSSGALFTSIQLPHPWSSQFHWIEVRRAALHHRATLLFSLKNDPRFLSFLPMVFPIPPSPRRALQPKDSAVALVFCTRRLATLYPGYPERSKQRPPHFAYSHVPIPSAVIQGHVLLDLEGILPFIPYITEHDYDPCDLSRRLSPDIPSVRVPLTIMFDTRIHRIRRMISGVAIPTPSSSMKISSAVMSPAVSDNLRKWSTILPPLRPKSTIRLPRMEGVHPPCFPAYECLSLPCEVL